MPELPKLFVHLGRYGDLLSFLPVLYDQWRRHNAAPNLLVSEDFIDLFDAVSYVNPIEFPGHRDDLKRAMEYGASLGYKPINCQAKGNGVPLKPRTESFQRDPWAMAGYDERWEQEGFVIDRRNFEREQELREEVLSGRGDGPIVLMATASISSPLKDRALDLREVASILTDLGYNVIDLSRIHAYRIYDLLGLLDHALCLISCDSAPLHLAPFTSCPVIALVNPSPWYASLPRANHVYYATYEKFSSVRIIEAVMQCEPKKRTVVHVYPDHIPALGADQKRQSIAQGSWSGPVDGWMKLNLGVATSPYSSAHRDSKDIGDDRALPYVHDVIEEGMRYCAGDGDAVILTNTDVGCVPDLRQHIDPLLNRGACFGYRLNFDHIPHAFNRDETLRGEWDGGIDLFAFTRGFWREHRDKFPDAIMGAPFWDLHFRDLIRSLGGAELYGCIWHETHPSIWKTRTFPSNQYNQRLYLEFQKDNDRTRPYHLRWPVPLRPKVPQASLSMGQRMIRRKLGRR